MATLELPLAEAASSPQFPLADYYYRIPVRPMYKTCLAEEVEFLSLRGLAALKATGLLQETPPK